MGRWEQREEGISEKRHSAAKGGVRRAQAESSLFTILSLDKRNNV